MSLPTPFFREAGSGPGVVCLHANASSSSQWRALMARLAPRWHVLAPDGHGAGQGPAWPEPGGLTLADEAAALAPVFDRAFDLAQPGGAPFVLVGHSYGAAVALRAALAQPQRVRALVLYEPTLFALIGAASSEAEGIRLTVDAAVAALAAGSRSEAARQFIDYWMGPGSWQATPEARRGPIEAAIVHVGGWAAALMHDPVPLSAYAALSMPVLLMTGQASTPAAHAVAQRLRQVLPRCEHLAFEGLGHMAPVTQPEVVNTAIEDFLARL